MFQEGLNMKLEIFVLLLGLFFGVEAKFLTLSIEGGAGAGKSTLLEILEKEMQVTVIQEAFDAWNDINGKGNLFQSFSNDPIRWAFTQNMYASMTKFQRYHESEIEAECKGTLIFDRCFYADRYIFARLNSERGYWQPLEQELHRIMIDFMIDVTGCTIHGIIYLRTSPETCYKRVEKRNNSSRHPLNLTRDFYDFFHTLHEDWLIDHRSIDAVCASIPVLIIDGSVDFEHDDHARDAIIGQVRHFIKQLSSQAQLVNLKA